MPKKTINVEKMLHCMEGEQLDIYCEHLHAGKQTIVKSEPLWGVFHCATNVHFCTECAGVPDRMWIITNELLGLFEELGRQSRSAIN